MLRKTTRIFALLIALITLLSLLPACQKTDPFADNGFSSLTIHKKGEKVEATVTLGDELVEAHTGTRAFLYELRPGETVADLSSRDPLDNAKVRAKMEFEFPLTDGGYNRVYSAFVIVFNDGSLLSYDGYWIENPELLADNTAEFPWESSPKGLVVSNPDDAAALGVMHAMVEVSLAELVTGTLNTSFNGRDYGLSAETVARLDGEISSASAAGMQVSLSIKADTLLSTDCMAATLDYLAARYTSGRHGNVTAIFLSDTDSVSEAELALWCRLANQALLSRVKNGRVYVGSCETGISETKAFFAEIDRLLSLGGPIAWGALVALPESDGAAWETPSDPNRLSPATLGEIGNFFLRHTDTKYAQWLAVTDLSCSALDQDVQAASFAYAYYAADSAGADLIFYAHQTDEAAGIYAANGDTRRMASLFASIDCGLNATDASLCARVIGEAWEKLDRDATSRVVLTGLPSVGTSGDTGEMLFDFSGGDTHGVVGVGTLTPPATATFMDGKSTALCVGIDPASIHAAGGIRKILTDASALENTTALAVRLYVAGEPYGKASVALRLDGVNTDGARISYESVAELENGDWQTVDFRITSFTAELDLTQPVVMTLSAEPQGSEDAFELWVQDVRVSHLEKDYSTWITLGVIVGCVLVTALLILVIYRLVSRRRFE